jgi:hypothetical protein
MRKSTRVDAALFRPLGAAKLRRRGAPEDNPAHEAIWNAVCGRSGCHVGAGGEIGDG